MICAICAVNLVGEDDLCHLRRGTCVSQHDLRQLCREPCLQKDDLCHHLWLEACAWKDSVLATRWSLCVEGLCLAICAMKVVLLSGRMICAICAVELVSQDDLCHLCRDACREGGSVPLER